MRKHLVSAFLLAILIALGIGSSPSSGPSTSSSTPPASSSSYGGSTSTPSAEPLTRTISGDNYYGCTERAYFEKLVEYAVQKDADAFKTGLALGIANGNCTFLQRGETVHIADTAIFSGLVKVRRQGELVEYWTNMEATSK